MRLPVRALAVTVGILTATLAAAQTAPQREIPGSTVVVTPPTQTITVREATIATPEGGPQPLGFESDLHCFGYIGDLNDKNEKFVARVVGAESIAEQIDYMASDLLYIDGGVDRNLKIGDEFWLVTPESIVVHPRTGKDMGRFYQYRGRARRRDPRGPDRLGPGDELVHRHSAGRLPEALRADPHPPRPKESAVGRR